MNYDNVGGGKSDPVAFSQSKYMHLQSYAADLVELGEALQLRDVIFVGHSVSGMIGLLASKKAPHLFSKMVFMNASPRYLNDGAYTGGFEKQDLMELYRLMASNYYAWAKGFATHAMGNPDKPQLANEFARTLSEVRPDVALAVAKAIFESDHRADLKDFSIPSLIIQSTKDIAVPRRCWKLPSSALCQQYVKRYSSRRALPPHQCPGRTDPRVEKLYLILKTFHTGQSALKTRFLRGIVSFYRKLFFIINLNKLYLNHQISHFANGFTRKN